LIRDLLRYQHTITYTGSLPLEKVGMVIEQNRPANETLKTPPAYTIPQSGDAVAKPDLLF